MVVSQLNSADSSIFGSATLSDELSLESERQLLQTLLERVSMRIASEQQIESQHASEDASEQGQYQAVFHHLTETYDQERYTLEQAHEAQIAQIESDWQAESARVQNEYQRVLNEAEDRYLRDHDAATKEHDEAIWLVSSILDDDTEGSPLQRLQQTQLAHEAAELELKTRMQSLEAGYDQVVRFLQRSHIWSEPEDVDPKVPAGNVEEMKNACLAAIGTSEPLRHRIMGRLLPKLFIGIAPLFVYLGFFVVLFGGIWAIVDPAWIQLKLKQSDVEWAYIAAGVSFAFSFLPTFFLHLSASQVAWHDYDLLHQQRTDARYAYSVWEKTSITELNMLEAECTRLQELRVDRREGAIARADEKLETRVAEITEIRTKTLQQSNSAYPTQLNHLQAKKVAARKLAEEKYEADSQDLIFRRESDFRMLQTEFDKRTSESRRRYQQTWKDFILAWRSDIAYLGRTSDALSAEANAICPPWSVVASDDAPFPAVSPHVLQLGRINVDLDLIEGGLPTDARLKPERQNFDLPILLPLTRFPSLIIKASGAGREAAVKTLQSTMLRFLTSLPPGKVRFTIMDPMGLGKNFSAFMHLADFDEMLVTSRIWTEPSHIEKRLADLTEHMETVLQMYLRNEFSTIDEYNEFAGEVAEPYRVLVIANFPGNFTDVALRRLASIAEGGSKCGVYLLMSYDVSQQLPRGFEARDLEQHATVLDWTDEGFRMTDPDFRDWPLLLEQPPAAEEFGRIVRQAGQHSRDVRRVEVPFERVAPAKPDFWTSDSRSGIDVPIGRAGATKLQYLRLGKGTSQHVLIAGKTGSGKSTLLHALITNLALYYSPTEVEFYLIDFKKGVEFKVYADQQLPHARVIAIESDREFGVSVLERLDWLMRDRGERFRAAGVQDIGGFRNARPNEVMPRALLLVDEFQEFFVEDDAISQQAALLLDRLIRQGRAFGIHIVLGSQTLAGAYSLARSTLGQVAVRIALQCSETDAHLILSEENSAARLLSRPGEAIYNDANGLIEGNHPFQIVWLGEDEREGYLTLVRNEARGLGDRGKTTSEIKRVAESPPLVFEGNIPADPTTNSRLRDAVVHGTESASPDGNDRKPAHDVVCPCWLGDSVSMNGPIELRFGAREGGNVLLVGRDDQAALGVMAASAIALCSEADRSGQDRPTIRLLDGSLPNSLSADTWSKLASLWPKSDSAVPRIQVDPPRETSRVLTEMIEELHRRTDAPGAPVFLFIYDLARFRDLRKSDDEYSYSSFGGGEKQVSPAQQLTEILRDGPGVGIFTFIWVESYQSTQRWLSRDQMNRLDLRILFAMNANDSSSLVDSPQAGRLGENRALLYRGDLGTLEKFRPFSPPPADWIARLSAPSGPSSQEPIPQPIVVSSSELSNGHSHSLNEKTEPPVAVEPAHIPADELSDELPNIDDLHVE